MEDLLQSWGAISFPLVFCSPKNEQQNQIKSGHILKILYLTFLFVSNWPGLSHWRAERKSRLCFGTTGMWLVGEGLSLLEGVEKGSLRSIYYVILQKSLSPSNTCNKAPLLALSWFAFSCRKCLLNPCCYIDMSGPLLHPFKAPNPAAVRLCECFLLDAARGGLEQSVTPEGTSPAGGVHCTPVQCRECSAGQKSRKSDWPARLGTFAVISAPEERVSPSHASLQFEDWSDTWEVPRLHSVPCAGSISPQSISGILGTLPASPGMV